MQLQIKKGLFTAPINHNCPSLDELMLHLAWAWNLVKFLPPVNAGLNDPRTISVEAVIDLEIKLLAWEQGQRRELCPWMTGQIPPLLASLRRYDVGCFPSRIDSYLDFYVATVWNTYYTLRLLTEDIMRRSVMSPATRAVQDERWLGPAHNILASVPFLLADDLPTFVQTIPTLDPKMLGPDEDAPEVYLPKLNPGRSVGGLLLMHPLFVLTRLPFIPEHMRSYAQACLEWIGANMGIGQATIFAQVVSTTASR